MKKHRIKFSFLFILLSLVACQSNTEEQHSAISEEANKVNIKDDKKDDTILQDSIPTKGIDVNQPTWDLVKSAFPKIESFPVQGSVFPLQAIVIENDTLKMEGSVCYSFPKEITKNFIENHVDASDTLAIWFKENSSNIGNGTNFEHGIYPLGNFLYATKDYYIYYTLDYITGRGSYNISVYIATGVNQTWESKTLGQMSYSKFNTYETIDGEEIFKDRMVSEQNLTLQLRENKLVVTHYSGTHVIDDKFDVFENGKVSLITEHILD